MIRIRFVSEMVWPVFREPLFKLSFCFFLHPKKKFHISMKWNKVKLRVVMCLPDILQWGSSPSGQAGSYHSEVLQCSLGTDTDPRLSHRLMTHCHSYKLYRGSKWMNHEWEFFLLIMSVTCVESVSEGTGYFDTPAYTHKLTHSLTSTYLYIQWEWNEKCQLHIDHRSSPPHQADTCTDPRWCHTDCWHFLSCHSHMNEGSASRTKKVSAQLTGRLMLMLDH